MGKPILNKSVHLLWIKIIPAGAIVKKKARGVQRRQLIFEEQTVRKESAGLAFVQPGLVASLELVAEVGGLIVDDPVQISHLAIHGNDVEVLVHLIAFPEMVMGQLEHVEVGVPEPSLHSLIEVPGLL